MAVEFTPENKKKFEELLTHYPNKKSALLPTLWMVQGQNGYISREAMEYVAGLLDVSPAHVYSVVTFYTMFHQKPPGKYNLQVCRTLSCALVGAENITEYIKRKLKIETGQATKDGKFSLCEVECLASCGTGPMMAVNEKYYENLTPDRVDEILDGLK